jgi:hypothetical protein
MGSGGSPPLINSESNTMTDKRIELEWFKRSGDESFRALIGPRNFNFYDLGQLGEVVERHGFKSLGGGMWMSPNDDAAVALLEELIDIWPVESRGRSQPAPRITPLHRLPTDTMTMH